MHEKRALPRGCDVASLAPLLVGSGTLAFLTRHGC